MSEKPPPSVVEAARLAASTLSEALPYVRQHAGRTVVIKYGGHAMGDAAFRALFALDVVMLKQVGIHPVVVHGGGPQIGAMLERLRIKSEFVDGLRVTDRETAEIVEMVLSGSVNKEIVAAIGKAGGRAIGLSGKDAGLFRAKPLPKRAARDPESNIEKVLDLGFVGTPVDVDTSILDLFAKSDVIPVIAPVGPSSDGETFNINADTVAGAVAAAAGASRLYVLTDVAGVADADGNLIPGLMADEAEALIRDGVIRGGMIPKVRMCLDAVAAGVEAATILNGTLKHAILVEVFTDAGGGTMIRALEGMGR